MCRLCLCKLIADLHGYMMGLLGVEGTIFNVIPIKSCDDEDQQLEEILNHWSKEKDVPENPADLRKAAEGTKHGLLKEMFTFPNSIMSRLCKLAASTFA